MCRLFGFHSNVYLKVHKSLTQAENALATQSKKHPHGWGIGYYDNNLPIITKSPKPAFEDKSFDNASNFVTAQTVVAHIRKATVGKINVTNTHPFKYKEWVFAHNGHLEGFDQIKQQVLSSIHPKYRERIEGDTDSEHIFYLLLSEIKNSNLELKTISVSELAQALGRVILYFEQLDKFHSLGGVLTNILLTALSISTILLW